MSLALLSLLACGPGPSVDDTADVSEDKHFSKQQRLELRQHWPLPEVPLDPTNAWADDPYAQHFGQFLFYDTRFSRNGEVSCASCHNPEFGWSDGQRLAETLDVVNRHTPSLWNAGYTRWSFWDGRCDSLWCQAIEPFETDAEMGGNRLAMLRTVIGDPDLKLAYEDLFGELPDISDASRFPPNARPHEDPEHPLHLAWIGMRPEDRSAVERFLSNLGKAIAAFERRIVSREAPFDTFAQTLLTGEDPTGMGLDAISDSAARGLKLFLGEAACHFCHDGPNFTNQEFANVGLAVPSWMDSGDRGRVEGVIAVRDVIFNGMGPYSDDPESAADKLLYLTIDNEQEGQFKVPTLRNVESHPPYFHGGHAETLEDAVRHYGFPFFEEPEFGHREDLLMEVSLSEAQVKDIAAFLRTLSSGPADPELSQQPERPYLD